MRATLQRGVLAGLLAGLVAAVFSFVVAEPVLDRAIALEGASGADALVSRGQQKAFLFVAQPLVGAALGLVLAVAWGLLPRDVAVRPFLRSLLLGAGLFAALGLVPFLAYPPAPPGAGDPATVDDRTSAFLLSVALGIAVVSAGAAAGHALRRRGWALPPRAVLVVSGALAAVSVGLVVLPDPAGTPPTVPADLLWDFRLRSLGVQLLLWSVLAAAFGALTERADDPAPRSPAACG